MRCGAAQTCPLPFPLPPAWVLLLPLPLGMVGITSEAAWTVPEAQHSGDIMMGSGPRAPGGPAGGRKYQPCPGFLCSGSLDSGNALPYHSTWPLSISRLLGNRLPRLPPGLPWKPPAFYPRALIGCRRARWAVPMGAGQRPAARGSGAGLEDHVTHSISSTFFVAFFFRAAAPATPKMEAPRAAIKREPAALSSSSEVWRARSQDGRRRQGLFSPPVRHSQHGGPARPLPACSARKQEVT